MSCGAGRMMALTWYSRANEKLYPPGTGDFFTGIFFISMMKEHYYKYSYPKAYCDFALAKSAGLPVERFPETLQEAELAENVISQGLEALSLNQHEKILFEVHGINPEQDEKPDVIDCKLQELENILDSITSREDFDLARKYNAEYVDSRRFRLMFLRSRNFDCQATAQTMVQHFQVKRDLFGDDEVLGRDVHQSDLGPQDKQLLETGFLQVLPKRDVAGRPVLMIVCSNVEKFPKDGWEMKSEIRLVWYVAMAVLRDEQCQKKGIVCMIMNFSSFKVPMEIYEAVNNLDLVLPHRIVGAHYCYTDPDLRPFVAGFQLLLNEKDRYRMRIHYGTREEINFELQTFGIPMDACPISLDGTCCNTWHDNWLAMLRNEEEQKHTEKTILLPHRFDVLLGKHAIAREHTGTLRALHIVDMNFDRYEKLGKYLKTEVAEKIISIIHVSGGRFLKQKENGAWVEVEDVEARKKIAHWFRHARFKRQKQQQEPQQHQQESTNTEDDRMATNDSTMKRTRSIVTTTIKRSLSV